MTTLETLNCLLLSTIKGNLCILVLLNKCNDCSIYLQFKFLALCYDISALFHDSNFFHSINCSCFACLASCSSPISFLVTFCTFISICGLYCFQVVPIMQSMSDGRLFARCFFELFETIENCWLATSWCCLNQPCHQSHFQKEHDSYFS